MYSKETVVINPLGLHARPAADFVKLAITYKSTIRVAAADKMEKSVNAKSMVMLLSLSIVTGKKIIISAEGSDEQEAVSALVKLVESGFGEGA